MKDFKQKINEKTQKIESLKETLQMTCLDSSLESVTELEQVEELEEEQKEDVINPCVSTQLKERCRLLKL